MKSAFNDKTKMPDSTQLKKELGSLFSVWKLLVDFTKNSFPGAKEGWHYAGDKYGWSYRVSDPKRVLVYLLPQDKFFKISFVFGKKATEEILRSDISERIKQELKAAKVYAEGRGIRIDVSDKSQLNDLKKLISAKIAF